MADVNRCHRLGVIERQLRPQIIQQDFGRQIVYDSARTRRHRSNRRFAFVILALRRRRTRQDAGDNDCHKVVFHGCVVFKESAHCNSMFRCSNPYVSRRNYEKPICAFSSLESFAAGTSLLLKMCGALPVVVEFANQSDEVVGRGFRGSTEPELGLEILISGSRLGAMAMRPILLAEDD